MGTSFTMLMLTGIGLTVLLYLAAPVTLSWLGGDAETLPPALDYFRIYVAGTVPVLISLGMNPFINAQGFPKIGMLTIILGAVLNVILDPIFIFVLDMGVRGAALATVISQVVSCLWVIRFLTGKDALLRLKRPLMRPERKLLKEVVTLGIPGFIMAGTNCLVQVTCNATLKIYGGDTYIGIMTVINSVREIFSLPVTGLTQGAQPVISFNYGAREYRRVRSGIAFMSILGAIFTAVCWVLVLLFPETLLRLFTTDENLVQLGIKSMNIYFFGFVFMSLQFGGQSTFTALGKAKQAVFFSLLRKAFIVFPLTLLLPRWFDVDGVFLAEPVSNLIGGVACFATMMLTVWPMLVRKERERNGETII
jgi:putative MATE family efflux protein